MTGFEQPKRRQPIRSDRFIPTNSSFASFHVPEDFVLKSASPTKNDNNSFNADHEIAIGLVLGFKSLRKVLSFNSFAKQLSKRAIKDEGSGFGNKSYDSLSSPIHDPYVLSSSSKSLPLDDVVLQRPKKKKMIPICQSYSSLNAPGLRKDFYCNLISWSEKSNHVAVGLGLDVHVWGGSKATELLPLPEDLGAITCVTFSKDGVLAVGRKDGSIICYDVVTEKKLLARYVYLEAAICCLAWLPNCSDKLFVGDEQGSVVLLRISKREKAAAESGDEFDYVVMKKTSMKEHTQQICSMTFSSDLTQMAIGGNDNLVTVWDISTLYYPVLQYRMIHLAAVKALVFCPWAPALLATGAGTHDRAIRFWHTHSGTMLESHYVGGQVTSLIWSRQYRQLAVTFGFSERDRHMLAAIYSFPKFEQIRQVPGPGYIRILSAVSSPDGSCVCTAGDDGQIRFFEFWPVKDGFISPTACHVFGSDIIELIEGFERPEELIR